MKNDNTSILPGAPPAHALDGPVLLATAFLVPATLAASLLAPQLTPPLPFYDE